MASVIFCLISMVPIHPMSMHVSILKNLAYLMYDKDYYACKHVLSKKFKMFCNSMMNYLNTAIHLDTLHKKVDSYQT